MENPVTDAEKAFAFLAKMYTDLRDIKAHISDDIIDVDEWISIQTAATQFKLQKNLRLPIVVEYILAVFPNTSTSVTIQLGPRTIPVSNLSSGVFAADTRMQLEYEDDRIMTIAPAGIGHFEIMGRATKRVRDRP